MSNGLTPSEIFPILDALEAALRDLWNRLTPAQQRLIETQFLRVWQRIREARAAAASGVGLGAAIRSIGPAMRSLVWRLGAIGASLEEFFVALANIMGRFAAALGGGGGGAGAGGVGGGAAAGIVLVEVLVVLIAVIAVIAAVISIYGEVTTEIPESAGGPPCGMSTKEGRAMATVNRAVTVRAIGRRSSLKKAIDTAQEMCDDDSGNCKGKCEDGRECVPMVSLQDFEQWWRVFWTTTRIVFRCPCECVETKSRDGGVALPESDPKSDAERRELAEMKEELERQK